MKPTELRELLTVEAVIEAIGGNVRVAELTLAKDTKVVWNWYRRFHRFPSDTYCVMQADLVRRGYYAPPYLWRMRGFDPP